MIKTQQLRVNKYYYQEITNEKTDNMKNIITFLLVFFTATTVWAEKITVSGVVTDTNNEPLIGVNVTVKNVPGLGAITDLDGRYQIEID